jgi:predicted transcriptional regulator
MKSLKTISLKINDFPADLNKQLVILAAEQDRPKRELIINALRQYVAQEKEE